MEENGGFDVNALLGTLTEMLSTWGLRVLGALTVLVVGWIVAGSVKKGMRRLLERSRVDITLVHFFTGLVYYLVMAFVIIAVLGLFGIPTASLIAVFGAVALAIGLALQGSLSNFAAGVMLLLFRPFRVGDYIEAAGTAGSVESISLFSMEMNTPDNVHIIIPNSEVYGQVIKNYSYNDTRRLDLVVGVSYDDDLGKAMETMERVVKADSRVLAEPEPTIAVSEMADSSVNFVVRPWVAKGDYWPLKFDLTRKLKEELEAAGCSIPFPQRDVHVFQEQKTA